MNIFATSDCPTQSANDLDDKRLVKMILETGQMLSTVLRACGIDDARLYKSAYQNHPCTLWAGETRGNFEWLVDHGMAMCHVYTAVYGKMHSTEDIIYLASELSHVLPKGDRQEFCDCTEFKDRTDLPVTERYRLFMKLKWTERDSRQPTWLRRKRPEWYKPNGATKLILKK